MRLTFLLGMGLNGETVTLSSFEEDRRVLYRLLCRSIAELKRLFPGAQQVLVQDVASYPPELWS